MVDFESLGHEPEGSGGRGCLRVTLLTMNFSFYKRNWSLGKGSSWVIWSLVLTLSWHQKSRKSGWQTVASKHLQFHGTGVGTLALLTNPQKAEAPIVLGMHFESQVSQGHRSGRWWMPVMLMGRGQLSRMHFGEPAQLLLSWVTHVGHLLLVLHPMTTHSYAGPSQDPLYLPQHTVYMKQ